MKLQNKFSYTFLFYLEIFDLGYSNLTKIIDIIAFIDVNFIRILKNEKR
ncbi:hypothetical protein SAMN05444388_101618 [Flavobacterium johnsoniae]|uniref:Uncharacterized protein n=1 Tax=Flavobacterium johnsoniae TaxID=986 RepID=A0A1M5GYD6_FLAJO|nr:hypothetical protein SAMN05444388_101618 [Flavobacterium johnsoniae]